MFETRLCGSTQQQVEGQETQAGAREWDRRKKYCEGGQILEQAAQNGCLSLEDLNS